MDILKILELLFWSISSIFWIVGLLVCLVKINQLIGRIPKNREHIEYFDNDFLSEKFLIHKKGHYADCKYP